MLRRNRSRAGPQGAVNGGAPPDGVEKVLQRLSTANCTELLLLGASTWLLRQMLGERMRKPLQAVPPESVAELPAWIAASDEALTQAVLRIASEDREGAKSWLDVTAEDEIWWWVQEGGRTAVHAGLASKQFPEQRDALALAWEIWERSLGALDLMPLAVRHLADAGGRWASVSEMLRKLAQVQLEGDIDAKIRLAVPRLEEPDFVQAFTSASIEVGRTAGAALGVGLFNDWRAGRGDSWPPKYVDLGIPVGSSGVANRTAWAAGASIAVRSGSRDKRAIGVLGYAAEAAALGAVGEGEPGVLAEPLDLILTAPRKGTRPVAGA